MKGVGKKAGNWYMGRFSYKFLYVWRSAGLESSESRHGCGGWRRGLWRWRVGNNWVGVSKSPRSHGEARVTKHFCSPGSGCTAHGTVNAETRMVLGRPG